METMDMKRDDQDGFTLLEMMITLAVISILLTTVFSITLETYSFVGDNDVDFAAQNEANQGFERMTELLRKCGWSTLGGVDYPRVTGGGKVLLFRVLRDLDGNGYPFSQATGELEWSPEVYSIQADVKGDLRVYDALMKPVWHLCRHTQDLAFQTHVENGALQLKEIRVNLGTRKTNKRGETFEFSILGSIVMRN
jgi:prepilin-type N-terminal cleavage/methylation domain-containing protein